MSNLKEYNFVMCIKLVIVPKKMVRLHTKLRWTENGFEVGSYSDVFALLK